MIKSIATLMVMALHLNVYRIGAGYPSCTLIRSISGIAIPLFFMVSGYLMAKKDSTFRYSLHKCLNILKVTILFCIVYDLFFFIKNGNFLYSFPRCYIQQGYFWHFWYFGTMMILYLALPLLNKLSQKSHVVSLLILFCINICWWVIDVFFQFENNHIIQTFRLWYFVFYFLLGSYLYRYPIRFQIRWCHILIAVILYEATVYYLPAGGIEYQFGSPFCAFYALSVFLYIVNTKSISPLFSKYSSLVLPIYCLHVFVLHKIITPIIVPKIELIPANVNIVFIIELSIYFCITVVFAYLFTKIPKYSQLFKL